MSAESKNHGQKKRVAIYGRVGHDQPEIVFTQIKTLVEVVGGHPDWVLTDLFFDFGPADPELKNTPGLRRLLEAAEQDAFDCVVAANISRISRSMPRAVEIIRRLEAHGVEVDFILEATKK